MKELRKKRKEREECDAGVRAERPCVLLKREGASRALGLSLHVATLDEDEGSAAAPPFSRLVNPAGVTDRGLAVEHSVAATPPAAEQAGQTSLDGEKICMCV